MKQKVHYIHISEGLTWYGGDLNPQLVLKRGACIQRSDDGEFTNNTVRIYENVSEASILRLAKIQEKLAK